MNRLLVLVLAAFELTSCAKKSVNEENHLNLKYIFIKGYGSLDTIHRSIEHWKKTDSVTTISYNQRWPGDSNVVELVYKLPMTKDFNSCAEFQLIDSKTFNFEGKDYTILKYLYDEKSSSDEEMLVFYSDEFGIIIFRSAAWGNYDRLLISNHKSNDRIVFYLVEMIANNDNQFFISSGPTRR